MNVEETKAAIAVMQAFVDGEEIEYDPKDDPTEAGDSWFGVANPVWNWDKRTYRIKKEPQTLYAIRWKTGELSAYSSVVDRDRIITGTRGVPVDFVGVVK